MLNSAKNKYVVVKGKAGLGNRMQSLLTGILYSKLSGRKLYIDWSDPTYTNDGTNSFHRFFKCPLVSPNDQFPEADSVSPDMWNGNLHKSVRDMERLLGNFTDPEESRRRLSIDPAKLDYSEDLLIMWTHMETVDDLRGYFNGKYKRIAYLSTDQILKELLKEYLILHSGIRERVDQFRRDHFHSKTIGMHVRYSDRKVELSNILGKLESVLKRIPSCRIFLATDNEQIKKELEKSYPNVITAPHWYPAPGSHIHQNRNCPDRIENGIEALVDLYLLAECDYLILDSRSSFSYLAKLLSKAPGSHIYDVNKTRKRRRQLRSLILRLSARLGLYALGLRVINTGVWILNRLHL